MVLKWPLFENTRCTAIESEDSLLNQLSTWWLACRELYMSRVPSVSLYISSQGIVFILKR